MHARSPAGADPLAVRYGALLDLGRVLTGIVRPDDVYGAIADRVARALGADAFLVSACEPADDRATVVFASNTTALPAGRTSYRATDCLAIRDARPVAHLPGDPAAACAALGLDARDRPAIAVPILREGRPVGSLTVMGRTNTVYDAADLEFLAAVANLVATTAAPRTTPSTANEAERVGEAARAIAQVALADALEQIAHAATECTAADAGTIWLVRTGGELEAAHTCGSAAPRKGSALTLSHGLFRGLAERRDAIIIDERQTDDDALSDFKPLLAGPTGIVLPLTADGRTLGALAVSWKESRIIASAIATLQRLAPLAAVAIAYARLHDQINALSLIDPLTGLANKRHLAMFLEKEFAAARRGRRLTLLLLDIDEFDEYNRKAGRAAGDAMLRAFAEVITTQTRAMNLAARYDGDEFIVALTDADRRAGFIHASRIAKALAAHPLITHTGLHVSVGIASFSPRMASFDDLLRGAHADLATRKKGGGRLTI